MTLTAAPATSTRHKPWTPSKHNIPHPTSLSSTLQPPTNIPTCPPTMTWAWFPLRILVLRSSLFHIKPLDTGWLRWWDVFRKPDWTCLTACKTSAPVFLSQSQYCRENHHHPSHNELSTPGDLAGTNGQLCLILVLLYSTLASCLARKVFWKCIFSSYSPFSISIGLELCA